MIAGLSRARAALLVVDIQDRLSTAMPSEVLQRTVSETSLGSGAHRMDRLALEFELTNAKPAPATLEVRQSRDAPGYRVVAESQAHFLKNGQDVWRVRLPANAAVTLSYTIERKE